MVNDFKLPPLTGEQMYSILSNLGQRDGEVLKALNEEIERELKNVSFMEIAEQLQASLQTIDDDEILDRYYANHRGFYDQDDCAIDSYKDRLEPFELVRIWLLKGMGFLQPSMKSSLKELFGIFKTTATLWFLKS